MTLTTPYLIYIVGAYALTVIGFAFFLGMTFFAWKKSKVLVDET